MRLQDGVKVISIARTEREEEDLEDEDLEGQDGENEDSQTGEQEETPAAQEHDE